jgi:hypothetical protein
LLKAKVSFFLLIFTILKAVGGFALYIGLLLVIDKQARELLGLVIEEIRGSFKTLIGKGGNNSGKKGLTASEN